jgi:hypothetical protein
MPKTAQVTVAGRAYLISEKMIGPAAKWRDHLNASQTMRIFKSLDGAMAQLVAALDSVAPNDDGVRDWGSINVASVINVAELLPVLVNGLSHSIDEIIDMVFDYSPELAADREWIEENAPSSEAVAAFVEILKLCFPFLGILALLGPRAQPTSTNSPSPNGASGRKGVGHRTKA